MTISFPSVVPAKLAGGAFPNSLCNESIFGLSDVHVLATDLPSETRADGIGVSAGFTADDVFATAAGSTSSSFVAGPLLVELDTAGHSCEVPTRYATISRLDSAGLFQRIHRSLDPFGDDSSIGPDAQDPKLPGKVDGQILIACRNNACMLSSPSDF
jgi:hypothetical protein